MELLRNVGFSLIAASVGLVGCQAPESSRATLPCYQQGAIAGLSPIIDRPNADGLNRIGRTRVYLTNPDKNPDSGVYSITIEPEALKRAGIIDALITGIPALEVITDLRGSDVRVDITLSERAGAPPKDRVSQRIKGVDPRKCNVLQATWNSWKITALRWNDQPQPLG